MIAIQEKKEIDNNQLATITKNISNPGIKSLCEYLHAEFTRAKGMDNLYRNDDTDDIWNEYIKNNNYYANNFSNHAQSSQLQQKKGEDEESKPLLIQFVFFLYNAIYKLIAIMVSPINNMFYSQREKDKPSSPDSNKKIP